MTVSPNYVSSVLLCASSGGFSSIFALSNVICLSIESAHPPMNDTSDRPNNVLNMVVMPQKPIPKSNKLTVVWTHSTQFLPHQYWFADYFVPLVNSGPLSIPVTSKQIFNQGNSLTTSPCFTSSFTIIIE